jgi:hypothetical protein
MPYLKWVKALSHSYLNFKRLVKWMEIGTEPLQWVRLSKNPEERGERWIRTEVTLVEVDAGAQPRLTPITTADGLRRNLQTPSGQLLRLFIVEDLSQQVIAAFGARFRTDPSLFREHIDDYTHSKFWKSWNTAVRQSQTTDAKPICAHEAAQVVLYTKRETSSS